MPRSSVRKDGMECSASRRSSRHVRVRNEQEKNRQDAKASPSSEAAGPPFRSRRRFPRRSARPNRRGRRPARFPAADVTKRIGRMRHQPQPGNEFVIAKFRAQQARSRAAGRAEIEIVAGLLGQDVESGREAPSGNFGPAAGSSRSSSMARSTVHRLASRLPLSTEET